MDKYNNTSALCCELFIAGARPHVCTWLWPLKRMRCAFTTLIEKNVYSIISAKKTENRTMRFQMHMLESSWISELYVNLALLVITISQNDQSAMQICRFQDLVLICMPLEPSWAQLCLWYWAMICVKFVSSIFWKVFNNSLSGSYADFRDVTRLDGALVKKQVGAPNVRTWGLSEANLL